MLKSTNCLRGGVIALFIFCAITISSPAAAEKPRVTGGEDLLEEDCAQQPNCKSDCVCEGKTAAQVLAYYNNYTGDRAKMTDPCALACWYEYKGQGIGSQEAIESCIPYMNRACTRCKNVATPVKATTIPTSKPLPTKAPTLKPTLEPTRSLPTAAPTAALPTSIRGKLTATYTLPNGSASRTVPLPNALVTVSLAGKQMAAYADDSGSYTFADLTQQLRGVNPQTLTSGALIQVDLRSINPAKLTTPNFELYYQNSSTPVSVKTVCPVTQPGGVLQCDVDLAKTTFQDTGGVPKERLIPLGLIYYFADRADRMEKKLDQTLNMLPVSVHVFYQNTDKKKAWWQAGTVQGGRNAGNIYVSENMFRVIATYNPLSFTIPHEFGHQLMADRYNDQMPKGPNDKNHGGYCANPTSTDAWVEGFATFFASMVKRDYYGKEAYNRQPIQNAYVDLEINHKAWYWEEIAAAGILFDLVDGASDYPANMDDDGVQIKLDDLWKILITPVNYYSIKDMVDLYTGLKTAGVGQTDADQNGMTALDDIFIAHGFYERLDSDPAYNPGEKIGFTSHRGVTNCVGVDSNYTEGSVRRSPPDLKGSYIQFNWPDQAVRPPLDAVVTVNLVYDPPYQAYNFSYEVTGEEFEDNRLYLVLPPPDYPARAVITIKTSTSLSPQTVEVSGQEFWAQVSRGVDQPIKEVSPSSLDLLLLASGGGIVALCCGAGVVVVTLLGLVLLTLSAVRAFRPRRPEFPRYGR